MKPMISTVHTARITALALSLGIPATATLSYADDWAKHWRIANQIIQAIDELEKDTEACGVDLERMREIRHCVADFPGTQPDALIIGEKHFEPYEEGLIRAGIVVKLGKDASVRDCKLQPKAPGYLAVSHLLGKLAKYDVERRVAIEDLTTIRVVFTALKGEKLIRANREARLLEEPGATGPAKVYPIYANLGDDELGITAYDLLDRVILSQLVR